MTHSQSNPAPAVPSSWLYFRLGTILNIIQRIICLAMLGAVAFPVLIVFGIDDRIAAIIACGGAVLTCSLAMLIWVNPISGDHHRREARGLTIVAGIVLLLVVPLMTNKTLHNWVHHFKPAPVILDRTDARY